MHAKGRFVYRRFLSVYGYGCKLVLGVGAALHYYVARGDGIGIYQL